MKFTKSEMLLSRRSHGSGLDSKAEFPVLTHVFGLSHVNLADATRKVVLMTAKSTSFDALKCRVGH